MPRPGPSSSPREESDALGTPNGCGQIPVHLVQMNTKAFPLGSSWGSFLWLLGFRCSLAPGPAGDAGHNLTNQSLSLEHTRMRAHTCTRVHRPHAHGDLPDNQPLPRPGTESWKQPEVA